jgi:hypothetical protein
MRPIWLRQGRIVGVGVWLGGAAVDAVGVADWVADLVGVGSDVEVPVGDCRRVTGLETTCGVCVGISPGLEEQATTQKARPIATLIKTIHALQTGLLPAVDWVAAIDFKQVWEDLVTASYFNQ